MVSSTASPPDSSPRLKLHARLMSGQDIILGPGKADLLDAILSEGSISAAAKSMGLSYRRAWLMVDTMNKGFREPLVAASQGGRRGGGASVTPFGQTILADYRALQDDLEAVADRHYQNLKAYLPQTEGT